MERGIEEEDSRLLGDGLTRRIIQCAISVHRELGPGLLESAYRRCLVRELELAHLSAQCEIEIPFVYKNVEIPCGYRADLIVDRKVLLELKTVDRLLPIHEAQLLTYLKLARLRVGFLMNFNAPNLRHGLRRLVM